MKEIEKFEDMEVWQAGMELVQEIYGLTEKYPIEERPGLCMRMRVTAMQIPAKIAASIKCGDNIKLTMGYQAIAGGLLAMLETYLDLSVRLKFIKKIDVDPILEKCQTVDNLLTDLFFS